MLSPHPRYFLSDPHGKPFLSAKALNDRSLSPITLLPVSLQRNNGSRDFVHSPWDRRVEKGVMDEGKEGCGKDAGMERGRLGEG